MKDFIYEQISNNFVCHHVQCMNMKRDNSRVREAGKVGGGVAAGAGIRGDGAGRR